MSRYRQHHAVVATELGDEVVALQLETKRYYTLNATAACAWRALAAGAAEDTLARAIAQDFDIAATDAHPHVDTLVKQLLDWKLVEACD